MEMQKYYVTLEKVQETIGSMRYLTDEPEMCFFDTKAEADNYILHAREDMEHNATTVYFDELGNAFCCEYTRFDLFYCKEPTDDFDDYELHASYGEPSNKWKRLKTK